MRRFYAIAIALMIGAGAFAQDVIRLPQPKWDDNNGGKATLVEVLKNRRSEREYSKEALSDQVLSNVLWAACGINRPAEKKITAPSAINAQDVIVFVCRSDGAFRYDALNNTLIKVSSKDLRKDVAANQAFSAVAPVSLVLVSDLNKFRSPRAELGAMDAGYVSENICLICTAMGLKTVPRATMNKEVLAKELGLIDNQILELNHPIGK
jgi:nitroreductase